MREEYAPCDNIKRAHFKSRREFDLNVKENKKAKWALYDIKGGSPSLCMHRIILEAEYKEDSTQL